MAAEFIRIYDENPNPRQIGRVVDVLKKGGIIIYPTDTVYGMGCDITNSKALERLARIKGVKFEKHNWSFICPDLSNLSDCASLLKCKKNFKIIVVSASCSSKALMMS